MSSWRAGRTAVRCVACAARRSGAPRRAMPSSFLAAAEAIGPEPHGAGQPALCRGPPCSRPMTQAAEAARGRPPVEPLAAEPAAAEEDADEPSAAHEAECPVHRAGRSRRWAAAARGRARSAAGGRRPPRHRDYAARRASAARRTSSHGPLSTCRRYSRSLIVAPSWSAWRKDVVSMLPQTASFYACSACR